MTGMQLPTCWRAGGLMVAVVSKFLGSGDQGLVNDCSNVREVALSMGFKIQWFRVAKAKPPPKPKAQPRPALLALPPIPEEEPLEVGCLIRIWNAFGVLFGFVLFWFWFCLDLFGLVVVGWLVGVVGLDWLSWALGLGLVGLCWLVRG